MKRLTQRYRRWLAYRQRSSLSRVRRKSALVEVRRKYDGTGIEARGLGISRRADGVYELRAPANLSFSENYDEVSTFFRAVRLLPEYALRTNEKRVEIDFTTIESIRPGAALCLVSELDRWKRIRGLPLYTVNYKEWDPNVRRLLYEMGFFEVLNVDVPTEKIQNEKIFDRWIRFRTGTDNSGELAKELRVEFENIHDPFPHRQALFEALSEAIANAVEHAYPDDAPINVLNPRMGKRWWLSGSIDEKGSRVRVMFFDQGVTIPVTLPRKTIWEKIRGIMSSRGVFQNFLNDDGNMISAAMEYRRTATEKENRGRGMANLQRLADQNSRSQMRIISRNGYYVYSPEKGDTASIRDIPLDGTLIEWDLYLS